MIYQIASMVGAITILIAFAANQLNHMERESVSYQLLNLVGGACLCVAAVHLVQWGFILLEGSWTILSAHGLWRVWHQRPGGEEGAA